MPIDYSKYPPNWKEIRARIITRAGNCCEDCTVANGSTLYRWNLRTLESQPVKVVLTIAHLDHDETNWQVTDDRLKALCQGCHLRYDIPEKRRRRQAKQTAGQLKLL